MQGSRRFSTGGSFHPKPARPEGTLPTRWQAAKEPRALPRPVWDASDELAQRQEAQLAKARKALDEVAG